MVASARRAAGWRIPARRRRPRTGCGPARRGGAGRPTRCAASARAPGQADRDWSRCDRLRFPRRNRRGRRSDVRAVRSGEPRPRRRASRPAATWILAISATNWSRPRADSTRSRAVTSRSPVRGSWGRYPTGPRRSIRPACGTLSPASAQGRRSYRRRFARQGRYGLRAGSAAWSARAGSAPPARSSKSGGGDHEYGS